MAAALPFHLLVQFGNIVDRSAQKEGEEAREGGGIMGMERNERTNEHSTSIEFFPSGLISLCSGLVAAMFIQNVSGAGIGRE